MLGNLAAIHRGAGHTGRARDVVHQGLLWAELLEAHPSAASNSRSRTRLVLVSSELAAAAMVVAI